MRCRIKGIGEIALRAHDLDAMAHFYGEIVGLELIQRFETAVFFRVADGVAGHTQMLGLLAESVGRDSVGQPLVEPRVEASTLHHFALEIAKDDFEPERERLEGLGCDVTEAAHEWAQVRSLYVNDPEGNVVEWVCFDPSL